MGGVAVLETELKDLKSPFNWNRGIAGKEASLEQKTNNNAFQICTRREHHVLDTESLSRREVICSVELLYMDPLDLAMPLLERQVVKLVSQAEEEIYPRMFMFSCLSFFYFLSSLFLKKLVIIYFLNIILSLPFSLSSLQSLTCSLPPTLPMSLKLTNSPQTDGLVLFGCPCYIYTIYTQIYKYKQLSPFSVVGVHNFGAHRFVLDNQLKGSFLGKTASLFSSHQLPCHSLSRSRVP